MKKCKTCNDLLPLSSFYVHSQMPDGHLNKCIECTKKRIQKHRLLNLERIQAYDRERGKTEHRKKAVRLYNKRPEIRKKHKIYSRIRRKLGLHKESQKAWNLKNRHKRYAQCLLNRAVKKGLVQKHPCKVCGKKKVEGHHEDYTKPLEVIWLCRLHHAELHRKYKDE